MSLIHQDLPLIQNDDLNGKTVLVRFDHNVVKGGQIRDPFRIDRTIGTLFHIVERGGRPILMTHVGRPKDKKTGAIRCRPEESVEPIVRVDGVQLHGAVGYTAEYDIQLYLKRSKWARPTFGDSDFHYERVARLGGL